MPATVIGATVIATKQADGTVQILWQHPTAGHIRFAHVFTSADFTSLNTTVNGGAAGATLTLSYAQDANLKDYPAQAPQGE